MSRNRITIDNTPKRRWLTIGPGIVIALAISALIGSQWIKAELANRRERGAPPIVERQVVSSSYEDRSGPTPEVSFILNRADKLHLTDGQLARLKALQSKWLKFYGPKIAEANQAAERTNKYLAHAGGRSRTPMAQIQNAAGPVIALSREISAARHSYWDQAVKILYPKQSALVQHEREADWAARKAALAHPHKP